MKSKSEFNNKSEKSLALDFLLSTGRYIKRNFRFLLLFILGFGVISFVSFVKISTAESVASFIIDDYEIGQISDRTVIAEKDLPPDDLNPVAIQKGEKVLKKGFEITEESYEKLKKMAASPVYFDKRTLANSELYLFIVSVTWYLLLVFIYKKKQKLTLSEFVFQVISFCIIFSAAALCSKFILFNSSYSICVILPIGLFVVLLSILYGQMPAVIFSFILSLGILNAGDWSLVPALYTLFTSLSAVALVRKIERRIDLIFVSIMLALVNIVFMLILSVLFNETLTSMGFVYFGVALNGFLSGLLVMGIITPLETVLNTASVFRLMDLSDLNTRFLKDLFVQASGTYQHSLMVAQLSENACREIGANFLVARVGAYYHDIGKIDQSEYFVENQHGQNKHDELNPSLSASVIRMHVNKGVEKARKLHLPQVIIDIIAEHHGNGVIQYFYYEALKENPNANPADFSYTGTPPSTRESGVVMLADTVEAACRTLENKSVKNLENFINKLFNAKIESGQLGNCNLTLSDLAKTKQAFLQVLAGYYHSRINYPEPEQIENGKSNNGSTAASANEKQNGSGKVVKTENSDKPEKNEKTDKLEKTEKSEKIDKTDKTEKLDKIEKTNKPEKGAETSDKNIKSEKIKRTRTVKAEKPDTKK